MQTGGPFTKKERAWAAAIFSPQKQKTRPRKLNAAPRPDRSSLPDSTGGNRSRHARWT
jgi:hypothetical protein